MAKQKKAQNNTTKTQGSVKGNFPAPKVSYRDASGKVIAGPKFDNYPPRKGATQAERQQYRAEYRKHMRCGTIPSTWGQVFKAVGIDKMMRSAMRQPSKFTGQKFVVRLAELY